MAESFHEEEILGKAYDGRLMKRLMRYLRPYTGTVIFALVATFLFGILQVVPPYLMKVEVDFYLAPVSTNQVPAFLTHWLSRNPYMGIFQIVFIFLVPAVLGTFIMQFAQSFAMQVVGQKIMYDLRKQIFSHLQRLQLTFYDRNPVGRMVTRLTTDVDVLNDLFASGVVAIFGDIFSLLAIVAVMLKINWKLALLTFAVLPLIVMVTMAFRRAVRESYRRIRVAIARINAYLQEHLTGMAVLQLFGREARSYSEFENINRAHMKAYKDSILAYGLFYPAVELLGSLAVIVILYYGGILHLRGAVTIGTLTAFIQYSGRFFRPIQDLSDKYNTLQSAMASSERIFKLLDTPITIEEPAQAKRLSASTVQGRIEFRDVSFAYDGQHRVVEHVSFTIEPGEKVALVGHTGAGKTTLTSLLLRFYEVTEGQILFDGVDIRELSLHDLRRNFGMVLQDPFLFSGTIESNIRLGTSDITDERLRASAEHVNILDFIQTLPGGFKEEVKERGSTLSVGQKQLLSFARALAHDPKVLILDEATSSVDPETEVIIRQGLERLMEGRTALIVAHRLSTIQNASKIVVMHRGRVREMGTHRELLERQGLYYKLYQLQYKDQELMAGRERLAAVATPPGSLDAERDTLPGPASE